MHILSLLYIFLPFLIFTPATTLSTTGLSPTSSENPLQTTQTTQAIAPSTSTPSSSITNPASSPSSGTYLPPTHLTSQTKSTLTPNSTASLILTPTTSSSNALESDWNKVTNWLSGSGASSLHLHLYPGSVYWGVWSVMIGVGVAWGGWW